MNLSRYVDDLRQQVVAAAALGSEETRDLADRLMAPVEAATRLVLLDVLGQAADEITCELAPASVEVRLRQGDPEFVVITPVADAMTGPATTAQSIAPTSTGSVAGPDDGATARVTLRLPEETKARIEQAAADAGLSVNAWLVRVTTAALGQGGPSVPGPCSTGSGEHVTGWVR